MLTNTLDMRNVANIRHPFTDYTLVDAVKLANNNRNLNLMPPVATLTEARDVVQDMHSRAGSTWITGMAALDVLDAAIGNRDLKVSCRLI